MYELTNYVDKWHLDAAWEFGHQIKVSLTNNPDRQFAFEFDHRQIMIDPRVRTADRTIPMMQLATLSKFMRRGPVLIAPDPLLCQALLDTEIRIPVLDYRQPYEVIGVELPPFIVGSVYPCLTFIWNPLGGALFIWTYLKTTGETLHYSIGGQDRTIEEQLDTVQGDNLTVLDWRILVQGTRVALNLCLLAATRPIEITVLPPKILKHRARPDDRLQQLAARHCQQLLFKNLMVKPRPVQDVMKGHGQPQGKQRRRGHWKNVAYGPRFSQHRWSWIDEYETHFDDDSPPERTVVLS